MPVAPAAPRSLRLRIVAAFLVAQVASQLALGFLLVQWRDVARMQALVTNAWLPLAQDVDAMSLFQQRLAADVDRLLRGEARPGAVPATRVYGEALSEAVGVARIHAEAVRALALDAEDRALANKATAQLDRLADLNDAVVEAGTRSSAAADAGGLTEPSTTALRADIARMSDEVAKLRELAHGRVADLGAATEARRTRATALAFGGSALATLVSLAMVGAVLYALRPIRTLTDEVDRVTRGEWDRQVDVRGSDEIAALSAAFNAMVRTLQARDRTLVERADELNRLSRYLASVLDGLDEGLLVEEGGHLTLVNPEASRVWQVTVGDQLPEALRHTGTIPRSGRTHAVRSAPFGEAGRLVVTLDVTDARASEERLARSERLALVGQMLAQVTHEIRNPLNALSLNAELLSDELTALDPERKTEAWDLLAIVSGEIERLTRVTAHYLQLARRPPATPGPEDLGAMLREVSRLMAPELERRGVALDTEIGDVPPQHVDGAQLRQAVLNVVRNAVDAGAQHLTLRVVGDADGVQVLAEDDGAGMSQEDMDRAGEPFFTTRAGGTGLGLAITRQILDDHEGRLELAARDGGGTVVTLHLPSRPAAGDKGAA